MNHPLKRVFLAMLLPPILGFGIACLAFPDRCPIQLSADAVAVVSFTVFVLAAFFGMAGPILYRSQFVHRHRNDINVSTQELLRFEKNLTMMVMLTPYMALAAYLVPMPPFHRYGTLLLALYAVYYYYPSEKRLAFDRRLFRTGRWMPAAAGQDVRQRRQPAHGDTYRPPSGRDRYGL